VAVDRLGPHTLSETFADSQFRQTSAAQPLHTIAMKNRSVPTDTVLPHLVYRDVSRACEWLSQVFGFTEHYRYGDPVSGIQMHLGDAVIMLHGPREGSESPATIGFRTQSLTIFVEDVDAHYARSRQVGAVIWEELHETIYGERQYGVKDLDNHRWLFSQHARDVRPEDRGATVATMSL
jgi:uncharacterized glyoxalase superfamily protein PhnB